MVRRLTILSMPLRQLPREDQLSAEARDVDPAAIMAFLSVLFTQAEIARRMDAHFGRYGLSYGRYSVLILLRRREGRCATPAEIAYEIDVTRATVTGLLDGLESEGLVSRSCRKDDRRSINVKLTKQGLALLDRMLPDHYARLAAVMTNLSQAEKTQLITLLGKVREGLDVTMPRETAAE
jgi:DNA-binding MarR family transcriptional regulator